MWDSVRAMHYMVMYYFILSQAYTSTNKCAYWAAGGSQFLSPNKCNNTAGATLVLGDVARAHEVHRYTKTSSLRMIPTVQGYMWALAVGIDKWRCHIVNLSAYLFVKLSILQV